MLFSRSEIKEKGLKLLEMVFKFLSSGRCKAENGVAVIVPKWLTFPVEGVERFSDRVMKVNIMRCSLEGSILLFSTGW